MRTCAHALNAYARMHYVCTCIMHCVRVCADASCARLHACIMCVHALCARVRMHYVHVCA